MADRDKKSDFKEATRVEFKEATKVKSKEPTSYFSVFPAFFNQLRLQRQCGDDLLDARTKHIQDIEHNYNKPLPSEKDFESCRAFKKASPRL
jgi:hypothetical protein